MVHLLKIATPSLPALNPLVAHAHLAPSAAPSQSGNDPTPESSTAPEAESEPPPATPITEGEAPLSDPTILSREETAASPPTAPKRKIGTSVALSNQAAEDAPSPPQAKKKRVKGPAKPKDVSGPQHFDASTLEGGDHNWKAPENQTGDGKTHLNDKFGY